MTATPTESEISQVAGPDSTSPLDRIADALERIADSLAASGGSPASTPETKNAVRS